MNTEVVKTNTNMPATFMQSEQVLKSDIVIPKLLLMQGLSDFVSDRKAQAGDMVRSTNAEALGSDKKPMDIIPLTFQNLWMVSENLSGDGKTFDFTGYEARTIHNENEEWEFFKDGHKCKRTKVMNLFALLPQDIDAQSAMLAEFEKTGAIPDVDKALLPIVIQFRSSSFKAGKDVATIFAKARSISEMTGKNIPAYGTTLKLSCYQEKNDKGTFFIYSVSPAGKTKDTYLEVAKTWYEILMKQTAAIKVDEGKEEETVPF